MRPAGLEPATHSLEGCCSIHLSYGRSRLDQQIKRPQSYRPQGVVRSSGEVGWFSGGYCVRVGELRAPAGPCWGLCELCRDILESLQISRLRYEVVLETIHE